MFEILQPLESVHVPFKVHQKFDRRDCIRLLNDLSLTHVEVAKRLGCTRERVRQIDLEYCFRTGRDRQRQQKLAKTVAPAPIPVNEFFDALSGRGIEAKLLTKKTVLVNGTICRTGTTYIERGPRQSYIDLRPGRCAADFFAFKITQGWLIVPAQMFKGREATTVSLNPLKGRGTYSSTHGWPNFINAWHLLGENNADR